MGLNREEKIEMGLHSHLDQIRARGYDPIYLGIQGSQNYGLDYDLSDIDTKAIVLPSLKDVVLNNQPISTTEILENNEHCDVKDIRLMFKNFKKQNINFLEILFTPYVYIKEDYLEEFNLLRAAAEDIVRYDEVIAIKAMAGMAYEKFKAMEHPYPTIIDKIEKYGYDAKQLHHIVRMREFMERYIKGERFKECLNAQHKEYLMKIKTFNFSLTEARLIAETELNKIDILKDKYIEEAPPRNEHIEDMLNDIVLRILSKKFKGELV